MMRRFIGVTHHEWGRSLMWSHPKRRWMLYSKDEADYPLGNTAYCNSFRTFKRHLRRHPELRQIGEVVLVSRYIGYDITATWVEEG